MRKLLVLLLLIPSLSFGGSSQFLIPPDETVDACQMRLSVDGRVIAEMRWNLKFDVEKAHAQFQPPLEIPKWFVERVRGWIDSAYKWEGTPVDWFNSEWERCDVI